MQKVDYPERTDPTLQQTDIYLQMETQSVIMAMTLIESLLSVHQS